MELSLPVPPVAIEPETPLYEQDFYAWTQLQVDLMRRSSWDRLDIANLIEEIDALGKQQRQELRNRLGVLIGHLLKWHYQPGMRSRSWLSTIRLQRLEIADLLADNPSLKPYLTEAMERAYLRGLELAILETNLPYTTFPTAGSYSLADVLDGGFYPGDRCDLLDELNG
jgi:hypothetical protein